MTGKRGKYIAENCGLVADVSDKYGTCGKGICAEWVLKNCANDPNVQAFILALKEDGPKSFMAKGLWKAVQEDRKAKAEFKKEQDKQRLMKLTSKSRADAAAKLEQLAISPEVCETCFLSTVLFFASFPFLSLTQRFFFPLLFSEAPDSC